MGWAYQIPFAVQWVWPVPLFCIVCFCPESPWWLVRRGRLEDAEKSLSRLTRKSDTVNLKDIVAMMAHTDRLEGEIETGSSYLDCFKGVDLRRTEISCVAWVVQLLPGYAIGDLGTYFFEQAGLPTADAFKLGLGGSALAFIATVSSWFLLTHFGRRTIYISGLCVMLVLDAILAFSALGPASDKGISWAQSIMELILASCTEQLSDRLRTRSLGKHRLQGSGGRQLAWVEILTILSISSRGLFPHIF